MKANELRIGNKLQKSNGEIFTVLRLDNTDDILVEEQRGLLTLNYNLFGIPITEEWLLKFGFEFIKTESAFNTFTDKDNNYFLQTDNRKNNGIYKILYDDGHELIDFAIEGIKHVHQLQNLYFALTGEELIIK